jgi:hypothetical protein
VRKSVGSQAAALWCLPHPFLHVSCWFWRPCKSATCLTKVFLCLPLATITLSLQVRWLNRMLDLCHWYLLSTRVMLTSHSAALAALQASSSSSSSVAKPDAVMHYHEPGHKSTNPQQVYTPPHQQLAGSAATAVSLIRRQADVLKMVKLVSEDCRWVLGRSNFMFD